MNVQGELKILTKQSGPVLGDLFGIFFEDLNHAADGGLYAELVRNRSFEFDPIDNADYHSLTAWSEVLRGGKARFLESNRGTGFREILKGRTWNLYAYSVSFSSCLLGRSASRRKRQAWRDGLWGY